MVNALYRHWELAPPLEPGAVEMAEYFWYLDHSKAERELGFYSRDPGETLNETVAYVRSHFLGSKHSQAGRKSFLAHSSGERTFESLILHDTMSANPTPLYSAEEPLHLPQPRSGTKISRSGKVGLPPRQR